MNICYNHDDIEADKDCIYCGKSYCKQCLLLQGERKSVICKNCYEIYKKKFEKSKIRRMIYVVLSIAISGYFLVGVIEEIGNSESNEWSYNIIIVIVLLFAAIFNIIKISQMRKWLIKENYFIN